MRACLKRGLAGGASNDKSNKSRVLFAVEGSNDKIDELVLILKSGQKLNSWGAKCDSVVEQQMHSIEEDAICLDQYQVTTNNVDNFRWKSNVEFFI